MAETLDDDTTSTAILIAPELGAAENSVRGAQDGPDESKEGEMETNMEADVDDEGAGRYR